MSHGQFLQVEDLEVYQKLCHLHLENQWPAEEKHESPATDACPRAETIPTAENERPIAHRLLPLTPET